MRRWSAAQRFTALPTIVTTTAQAVDTLFVHQPPGKTTVRLGLLVGVCAALAFAAACARHRPPSFVVTGKTTPAGSRILRYRVVHNAEDHLALEVEYVYKGELGTNIFVGGLTTRHGRSTGHWAYRPDRVKPGRHWGQVLIDISQSAPNRYTSDALELYLYVGGSSTFAEATVPLEKTWTKVPGGPQCHTKWGMKAHS